MEGLSRHSLRITQQKIVLQQIIGAHEKGICCKISLNFNFYYMIFRMRYLVF